MLHHPFIAIPLQAHLLCVLGRRAHGERVQVVSTENYSEMQKGRIDYVPPQPDVLKGAPLHKLAAHSDAHCCRFAQCSIQLRAEALRRRQLDVNILSA